MHPRYVGPVIDAHCHYDATTRRMARTVANLGGLTAAVHLWDAEWPPQPFADSLAEWAAIETLRRCYVPDLSIVGAPEFAPTIENNLVCAADAGAVGVKVWKNVGLWETDVYGNRLDIDDDRLDVLWRTAAQLNLPVVIHQGEPAPYFEPLTDDNPRIAELRANPDLWLGDGRYPAPAHVYERFERLVASQPETIFIGAHFGCFMVLEDVARMLASYPNYNVDTSAVIADLGRDRNPTSAILSLSSMTEFCSAQI